MIQERMPEATILAGGFGVRAGLEYPKALVKYGDGQTLLGHLLSDLEGTGFNEIALVTNDKFYSCFKEHLEYLQRERGLKMKVDLLNDCRKEPDERLGALGDLIFALDNGARLKNWRGSVLVLPSDYAFKNAFGIKDFLEFAADYENEFLTIVRDVGDRNIIKGRFGCAVLGGNQEVISFEEKPEKPRSTFALVAFYLYRPKQVKLLQEFERCGGDLDKPSNIIPFLLGKKEKVFAFVVEKEVIDAGTPNDIARVASY